MSKKGIIIWSIVAVLMTVFFVIFNNLVTKEKEKLNNFVQDLVTKETKKHVGEWVNIEDLKNTITIEKDTILLIDKERVEKVQFAGQFIIFEDNKTKKVFTLILTKDTLTLSSDKFGHLQMRTGKKYVRKSTFLPEPATYEEDDSGINSSIYNSPDADEIDTNDWETQF